MQNESQMYCSDCYFFRNDGICKNPASKKRDVGYFQKAGSCFTDPAQIEQKPAEIAPIPPKIEQKPMAKEQKDAVSEVLENIKRKCAECGRELPIEQFQRNVNGDRISICKECMNKRRKAGKTKLPKGSPEQHTMLSVEKRMQKVAEITESLAGAALAAELRRRGYSGKLTRNQELNV